MHEKLLLIKKEIYMKKGLIRIFTLILTVSMGIQPVFAEDDSILTIDDYNSALQEVANEYDVNVSVNDYSAIGEITQEKIDEAKESVKVFAESFEIIESNEPVALTTNGPRRASKANRTRSGYFDVNCAYGSATIKVTMTATIGLENYLITNVYNKKAYQDGVAINFSSWTTSSISTTLNYARSGNVLAKVSGRAVFVFSGLTYSKNATGSCIIDFTA